MLQELLDGYLIFLVLYSLYKIIDAIVYNLKERPRRKREREKYLREMGRIK